MKGFGLCVLFLFVLMCLCYSTPSGMAITHHGSDVTMATLSRKLKQNRPTGMRDKSNRRNINLEDYAPIDPAPSSMTSIRPGPIQHGTPLMPYIPPMPPSPPVPDHPNHSEFP